LQQPIGHEQGDDFHVSKGCRLHRQVGKQVLQNRIGRRPIPDFEEEAGNGLHRFGNSLLINKYPESVAKNIKKFSTGFSGSFGKTLIKEKHQHSGLNTLRPRNQLPQGLRRKPVGPERQQIVRVLKGGDRILHWRCQPDIRP
jgi:hypothetical protein